MIISGSLNNYIQQKNLRFKAERNLKNPSLAAKGSDSCQISRLLEEDESRRKLGDITTKLKMGKTLTDKEKEYLKQQSPELYRQYQMIESERSACSKQLSKARSRKEGAAIHQAKLYQIWDEQRKNPSNSDPELYAYRTAAIQDEYNEYRTKGKEYRPEQSRSRPKDLAAPAAALRNKVIANYQAVRQSTSSGKPQSLQ